MGHTATPWLTTKANPRKVTAHGILICTALLRDRGTTKQNKNGKGEEAACANAARIVACVNACEGLTNEQLASGEFRKADVNADLLAANAESLDTMEKLVADLAESDAEHHAQRIAVLELTIAEARAAISRAQQGGDQP